MPIVQHYWHGPSGPAEADPFAFWGTYKMHASYAGSALRVRRSSDNAEQDIGFSGTALDTASLLSFVGAGDGFIVKLYNQNTPPRAYTTDIGQPTTADQPRIVIGGVLQTNANGTPKIVFAASDYLVTPIDYVPFSTGFTIATVAQITTNGTYNFLFNMNNFAGWPKTFRMQKDNFYTGNSASETPIALATQVNVAAGLRQWSFYADASAAEARIDGASNGSVGANNLGAGGLNENIYLGYQYGVRGQDLIGNFSAAMIWDSKLTAGQLAAREAQLKAVYGTP